MITEGVFKANDIRGAVPQSWDEAGAAAIGAAFVELAGLEGKQFVLGRDMRLTGWEMSRAFAAGAISRGAEVLDTGLASTDQLWFASGSLDLPGVQFTASHNPASDNGIKFCQAGAAPVSPDFLARLRDRALELHGSVDAALPEHGLTQVETLDDYVRHLHGLVPLEGLRHLKVVVDAGNGMAGHTVAAVLAGADIELVGLYLDLDGSFPNHQPNPLEPENLVDAQAAVREHGADLALVFDGDADRCFIIDERGEVVSPSAITALIARAELEREPGATIVINTITSRTVADVVAEAGGTTVTSKVGHTFVKALMAEHDAIFGGEHSAHYYFRDFWGADTGMLAALHVLRILGSQDQPLSEVMHTYERYVASGEINSQVSDAGEVMEVVEAAFIGRGEVDHTDGLTVRGTDAHDNLWWFNLRPSNTEPYLRLNAEALDPAVMQAVRDDVLDLVRGTTTT
ncbi:phosphomannomutase/phosphoglucomutase [Propionibacteriaceae bacterium Y1923]|uniref:phosphomannomutase/phosphoglucomutase n=1 Tax=Aestuariimicrobium sp. Y1814 TaxID=3418742 RepID=UPI003C17A21D